MRIYNNNDDIKNDDNNINNNGHKNMRIYIKQKRTLCHLLKFKCKRKCCDSIYKQM